MVSRILTFLSDDLGSIPGGVRNFYFYLRTRCVLCVLSFVVSGGGPDIVLATYSGRLALVYLPIILVHSVLLLVQASGPREFGL